MSRYQDYVNSKTGEEATGMLIIKGSRYPRGVEFFTVFTDSALYVATLGLSAVQHRVLLGLLGSMSFANFVRVSQKTISKELGIAASNLSASVKVLIDVGLLARQPDPDDASRLLLRVSLHLAWRGTAREWIEAITRGEGVGFAPIPARTPPREAPDQAL